MAGTKKQGPLGPSMSRFEIIGGFIYLPFYVIGLALLLELLFGVMGWELSLTNANLLYFLINFLVVALLFHRWLIESLSGVTRRFWPFVQAVILGFVLYYALSWLVSALLVFLDLTVRNPNDAFVGGLAGANVRLTAVCTVLLAPMVEETLFRGLIFGGIHRKSRVAAYVLSALLFAAIHVWQYVGDVGWSATLLCAVQYLPAGVALGWTYEKSGTIWAPTLVHCLINAVSMGILHGLGG